MNLSLKRILKGVAVAAGLFTVVAADDVLNPVVALCQSPGMFAMTFDQGPSILTGTVLDAFASRNVKASFHPVITFLNEATVVANLMRAAQEGHTVGLAIENSLDLSGMSIDDMMAAIDFRANTIAGYTGQKPRFLRIYNYQNMTQEQISTIFAKGYIVTRHNLDSYDYDQQDVLGSFKKVLDLLSPNTKGAFISVQRDIVQNSVNQTPDIIDYIISKGYNLVTLDQCVRNAGNTKAPSGGGSTAPPPANPNAGATGGVGKASTSAASSLSASSWLVAGTIVSLALFLVL